MAQKFTTGITVRDLASAASDAVAVSVSGDSNDRIKFEAGGKVVWGSGTSAGDVNLYRDAADRLKTDDAFQSDGGIITVTTAGTPTLSLPDGALAIDTTNNLLYIRTGGVWEIASGGGASVTTSDAAPSAPDDGDLWYETDTGSMFVYYDDGTSQQWVEVGTAGVIAMTTQSTAPSSPSNGDLWFDTDDSKAYVYYDDGSSQQWIEVGAAAASGTDGAVQFASGGSFASDATNFVWDDTNNRLGIGTTSPAKKLHVKGDNDGIRIEDGNATDHYDIYRNDTTGFLEFTGSQTSFSGYDFEVNNGTNVVRITNAGNVGIGTTSPDSTLQVNGIAKTGDLTVVNNGLSESEILIDSNNGLGVLRRGSGYFDIYARNSADTGYDTIYFNGLTAIITNDRVGIGTTTPSYKLDVNGDINATGDVRVAGNPVGMVLVKSQTIGSGVSSVTVTDAFSSTFENYRVIVDIEQATNNAALHFESPQETGSVYDWALAYLPLYTTPSWTLSGVQATTYIRLGFYTSAAGGDQAGAFVFDVLRPYEAQHTFVHARATSYLDSYAGGRVVSTAQLTDLRLNRSTGTFTGGTIRVYGYNNG